MRRFCIALGLLVVPVTACASTGPEMTGAIQAGPQAACARLAAETDVDAIVSAGEPVDGLALEMADCLGHPDPEIRDGFAYASLARLMRDGLVPEATRRDLLQQLSGDLSPEAADPDGFRKPFAALVLSEVARTDRIDPWMSDEERTRLVETASAYLENVSDYRGYDDETGWRHGVAHAADLLMQLSLNSRIGEADAKRMLDAIGAQVSSDAAPAYIFDEPRRLSRPVLFLVQRGLLSEEALTAWFEALAAPAPLSDWEEAFKSESALARRHNLRAFAYAVLVAATENEDENLKRLRPGALHILSTIP